MLFCRLKQNLLRTKSANCDWPCLTLHLSATDIEISRLIRLSTWPLHSGETANTKWELWRPLWQRECPPPPLATAVGAPRPTWRSPEPLLPPEMTRRPQGLLAEVAKNGASCCGTEQGSTRPPSSSSTGTPRGSSRAATRPAGAAAVDQPLWAWSWNAREARERISSTKKMRMTTLEAKKQNFKWKWQKRPAFHHLILYSHFCSNLLLWLLLYLLKRQIFLNV